MHTTRRWQWLVLWVVMIGSVPLRADAAAAPPNIIFILSDDHRWDAMGFTGRIPWLETPHMDRLRNEGAHFANAFVTHSLCAPSRAAFLTGMHSHKHGVITNQEGREFDHAKTPSFGQYLQKAGYRTGYVGKWHQGEFDDPRPGWDYWCSFMGQGQYDRNLLNINGVRTNQAGYVTDKLTDYAIDFIREDGDQPFLLFLSHKAVHAPFTPADRHADQYEGELSPEPLSWTDDLTDKPEWQRRMILPPLEMMRVRRKRPVPAPEVRTVPEYPAAEGTHEQRSYLRALSAVDDSIGRILAELEEKGQLDNTLVVYAGDNGYLHGEHGMGDKRQAYNESIRIPLLMRGPGVEPGSTVDELVLNLDVAPTFLDLAGVPVPDAMQGRSLAPLMRGREVPDWRRSFLYTYWRDLIQPIPRMTAARTLSAIYVEYPDGDSIPELYDLRKDPAEMDNLAEDPEHAAFLRRMKAELERLKAEAEYESDVPWPSPEDLEGRPLGVLAENDFGPDGLSCTGAVVKTLPMEESLDPRFGAYVMECVVTPESDGVILSMGGDLNGYLFYVQDGVPGFCINAYHWFQALDGDVACLDQPTHLVASMDNYRSEIKLFVNGEHVQTETLYCKLYWWNPGVGNIEIGGDPEPLVDPYDLSNLGGFKGTVHAYNLRRERMSDEALAGMYDAWKAGKGEVGSGRTAASE